MTDPRLPEREPDTGSGTEQAIVPGAVEAHGRFVQAPIPPLDENGIVATTVGTVVFAVAAVVLGLQYDGLDAAGHGWWLGVAIAGAALGLIGLAYCWRRRGR